MTAFVTGLCIALAGWLLAARARKRLRPALWPARFWDLTEPRRYLTDGVFRLRHPAYIGHLVMIAGLGIACLGWGGVICALPAFPFYADRLLYEEDIRRGSQNRARPKAA